MVIIASSSGYTVDDRSILQSCYNQNVRARYI